MWKWLVGPVGVLALLALGCEAPPPAPTPYEPPPDVEMRAEVVFPHAVASRPFKNDWYHFAEPAMEVYDGFPGGVSCALDFKADHLEYENRTVVHPNGRRTHELWVVGGYLEFTVRDSKWCWNEEDTPAGQYKVLGFAQFSMRPRPELGTTTTTTTTLPCGENAEGFEPGMGAGNTPGLCSEPFNPPVDAKQHLRPPAGAFRFVK